MNTPDTTADAIRRLCDALIRDDFAYGSDRLKQIIAHTEQLEAAQAESKARVERLRAYSEDLAWEAAESTRGRLTDANEAAAKHLMPGDLGDETLEELASLEPNWDGEGATSISAVAVASSAVLVTRAREATGLTPSFISPIADGGLQIEWQTPMSRLEVMVAPDGEQAVLLVNIADGASRNVIEEHDISAERAMELMRELCSRWTETI